MKLFVRKDCPHCQNVETMIMSYPASLRQQIKVSEINFKNRPPNVTRVPTLITQDGSMLVGENVFAYLKRWRHDANPPRTEAFSMMKKHKKKCMLLVLAFLAAAYWFFSVRPARRLGGIGTGGSALSFAPSALGSTPAVAAAARLVF